MLLGRPKFFGLSSWSIINQGLTSSRSFLITTHLVHRLLASVLHCRSAWNPVTSRTSMAPSGWSCWGSSSLRRFGLSPLSHQGLSCVLCHSGLSLFWCFYQDSFRAGFWICREPSFSWLTIFTFFAAFFLGCNLTKYIHSEYFVLMACNTLWQNNIWLDCFIQIQQFWTISFGDFSAMVGPNQKWFSQYTAPLHMLSIGIWFLSIGAMPSAKS